MSRSFIVAYVSLVCLLSFVRTWLSFQIKEPCLQELCGFGLVLAKLYFGIYRLCPNKGAAIDIEGFLFVLPYILTIFACNENFMHCSSVIRQFNL